MIEAAAANPAGLVGREAAGLGAGAANEAARAAFDGDHHPVADLLESIGGVSTLAVAKPVFGAVKSLSGAAYGSSAFADDVAREAVANELIAHSANAQRQVASGVDRGSIDAQPLANAMRQPSAAEELIHGYRSDVADRTGDPGLASYVFGHTAANPGLDTVRRAENQAAVADRMSDLAPQGSAGQFRADLQSGVDSRIARADTAAQDAEARTQRLIEAIMPRQTPQARGATVRSTVDDALGRFVSDFQERHAAATRAADEATGRLVPPLDGHCRHRPHRHRPAAQVGADPIVVDLEAARRGDPEPRTRGPAACGLQPGDLRRELQSAYGARRSEAVKLLDEAHDDEQRPVAAAVRARGALMGSIAEFAATQSCV